MYGKLKILIAVLFLLQCSAFAQFGKNKVQYKDFTWYYIQTDHFDIYFTQNGSKLAEFTSKASEDALRLIQQSFNYRINNRIVLIVYNSTNDFQETNITDEYLTEGIEGFTELFKNRVVVQFTGSYKNFRHLIHHELVHAVMNDMFYGGSIQNVISNNITVEIPLWFSEGMAEYQSLGWDIDTDMFIRDAALNEYLPDINNLGGYFAYRGGQSVFYYISQKYGKEKIGEIINKLKGAGNVNEALKNSIGIDIKELNERWSKDVKQRYWPDIALYKDPDEFAKRLTNHKEKEGFYNTSPAISPQGDKVAFITDRDYYFNVYLMNTQDGKIIKRIVEGNRTGDFEELNIITPGLTWSPDGKKIALAAKSSGYDVIHLIDVEEEDWETLPINMDGIKTVSWSPDGKSIAFVGHNPVQSDIYVYNLETKKLTNITDDIFSDIDPSWSPDSKVIYFASDRTDNINAFSLPDSFKIYKVNYNQNDIYSVNIETGEYKRITSIGESDERFPVMSPDNKQILFVSDYNGINNIYRAKLDSSISNLITSTELLPVTNSSNGIYQPSVSSDGSKLVFSTLFEAAFDIFLLKNPFEPQPDSVKIVTTGYVKMLNELGIKERELYKQQEIKTRPHGNDTVTVYTGRLDDERIYGDSVQIDFNNYVEGTTSSGNVIKSDTTGKGTKFSSSLDAKGNYAVNKYKITFTPDLVYANAGYSSLYGLLGTTVISFSDILGNHRLIGQTSLQIDLKNSDYGVAYYYLPERIDYGIQGFHTARFVYLSRSFGDDLFRFRNYGGVFSMSMPINKFYRFDAGLSWLNISMENLDNPNESSEKVSYLVPSLSFVHDNVLFGYTAPIDGSRYKFDVLGNPGIGNKKLGFYSLLGDYRTYFRFWTDYSFAFRLSGGHSGGRNAQRFFIGGTDNWINRSFSTSYVPLESASDFAFMTAALPLRGFDYAERIGTKYALLNAELRFPLIRYLVTGGLPLLFSNIIGTAFIDVGSAWDKTQELRFFERNKLNNVVSKDLLMGTGVGARVFFLYFLLKFDVAWAYNVDSFSKPKFYISLGADF